MLIPYNTDAPIYYFPFATIGMIVVNFLVFIFSWNADFDSVEPWILSFGDGLHPLQWLSSNFLHAGFLHIIGNMIFLWCFGLIVEGKLGWLRFTILYLALCVLQGMVVQLIMLGHEGGGSLGASGAIFGLLTIALVRAPKNEFECVILAMPRLFFVELSVLVFAAIYVGLQILEATFKSFSMSTPVLHLIGGVIGVAPAIVLLKWDIVDCEGWDIFTVMRGKEGEKKKKQKTKKRPPDLPVLGPQRIVEAVEQIRAYLAQENATAVLALDHDLRKLSPDWSLPEVELTQTIKVLHRQKAWGASIEPMVDYLRRFPEKSARMRLMLARILLVDQKRPFKALEVLSKIPASALSPEELALQRKLEAEAHKQSADAELEIAGDEW